MLVTIDTNVIYQALRSSSGASYRILQFIREGRVRIALSHQVLLEYEAVLSRKSSLKAFGLSVREVQDVLRILAFVSEKFEPSFLFRPNLRDEDDNIFVELAVVSQSGYLVTQNIRDYQNSELKFDSFRTVTPSMFLVEWRR
jgi:putative PIN family toxin of toxin-antitoxin system